MGRLPLTMRRLVAFQGLAQEPVQLARAHPDLALGADGLGLGQDVAQALAGRRPRRRAPARGGRCAAPRSSPASSRFKPLGVHQVDLVDSDEKGNLLLVQVGDEALVLHGQAAGGRPPPGWSRRRAGRCPGRSGWRCAPAGRRSWTCAALRPCPRTI